MSKYKFPVTDGGRSADSPPLKPSYSAIAGLGIVNPESGEIDPIRQIPIESISEPAKETPEKRTEIAGKLKPIANALDRAFENGDKALLVFYDAWAQSITMRHVSIKDGDAYAISQEITKRDQTKTLVLALDPKIRFIDQFPNHLLEKFEKWDCFTAQPFIAENLFPVCIVWGKHQPTGLPAPKPTSAP